MLFISISAPRTAAEMALCFSCVVFVVKLVRGNDVAWRPIERADDRGRERFINGASD